TIHPLAGQGVNLGFMDAAELVDDLRRLQRQGKDIGQHLYLRREKPAKVTALMAQWLVNGWCRETIFNLKLPMKKRYEEVSHNLA
ncbi:FAD-dependent 2-octaprenylphenol hydroxylase, partial [Salmonella enterica subsp. enterica serovar Montevideo]|nr:FAD-dependent 2-octaprenylphenol hydroxylase [Salmonella enterica subsp. enterica serovar Montevideo]